MAEHKIYKKGLFGYQGLRKRIGYFSGLISLSIIFSSCIYENFDDPKEEVGTSYYISLNISVPSENGSRSETNEEGKTDETEDGGLENEKKVTHASLYFYLKNEDGTPGDYVTVFTAFTSDISPKGNSGTEYTVKTTIKPKEFESLASKNLLLFIVANTSNQRFESNMDPNTAWFWHVDNDKLPSEVGTNGKVMPMVSADYYNIDLTNVTTTTTTTEFADVLKLMTDENHIFNLSNTKNPEEDNEIKYTGRGSVNLERSVARLDYKASSGSGISTTNLYQIGTNEGIYGKITSMMPFNIERTNFLFRHTSVGTKEKGSYQSYQNISTQLYGNERGKNADTYIWIADRDWREKIYRSEVKKENMNKDYFYNQPALVEGSNDVYKVTSEWSDVPTNTNSFVPMWYISENTPPSTTAMVKGFSSGIIFHFQLCDQNGVALTAEKITEAGYTLTQKGETDYYALSGKNKSAILEKVTDDANNNVSYYMDYWYFIRHNYNSSTHELGKEDPMQYAVVRNNLYQISVSGLNDFPTPYNPEDPDEPQTPTADIAVAIKVLPWVKRDITVGW